MTAFNLDDAVADLAKPQPQGTQAPEQPAAMPAPQQPVSAQPAPQAFNMDAAVSDLVSQKKEDDALNTQFLKYRAENGSVPPERQTRVFRTAAALRQMGETPDLSMIEQNLDAYEKRADASPAKWDETLRDHPSLKDYLLENPRRQDLISDDLKSATGLSWALRVPFEAAQHDVEQQKYYATTLKKFLTHEGGALEAPPTNYGAEHWWSKAYAGSVNMLPMLTQYTAAGAIGAQVGFTATGGAGLAAAAVTSEAGGVGAAPVEATGAAAGAAMATAALSYYQTVGPAYQRMINNGVRPEIAAPLASAEAGVTGAIFGGALPGLLAKLGINVEGAAGDIAAATSQALEKKGLGQLAADAALHTGENVAHAALLMGSVGAVSQTTNEVANWIDKGETPSVQRIADATADSMMSAVRDMALISAVAPFGGAFREAMHNTGEAIRLANDQKQLESALKATEESKLLERSPDEFKNFIATLGQSGLRKLYSPIDAFNEYWQNRRANPRDMAARIVGDDGSAYDRATQTGGDLVMPVDNYLTVLGKTEHARGLSQDLKIREDGRTPRQEQQRIEKRAAELAKIPDAEARMETGRKLLEDKLRQELERTLAGNKRIAAPDVVAEKTAKLQAKAFDRMAQEINKNADEGTPPVTAYELHQAKAQLEFIGQKGVRAGGDAGNGLEATLGQHQAPEVIAKLAKYHGGLTDAEKLSEYYRDRNTGLLNPRGYDLRTPDEARPMAARFALPGTKAINDAHGHLSVDGALRAAAKVLSDAGIRDAVKRGGDIEADVKDQAQANELAAAMSKALDPSGRLTVVAGTTARGESAATGKALDDALTSVKKDAVAAGVFPDRGQVPPQYASSPEDLKNLAEAWTTQPDGVSNSDLTAAHADDFAGTEPSRAFFDTYRDPTGILNELGVHRMIELTKPKFVVSSDGRGIGKMNEAMGKSHVNTILDILSEAFSKAGGGEFNIGRLHGDEYAAGGNDEARIRGFFERARKDTDSRLFYGTNEQGRLFVQQGVHFAYGIDTNFDRADRIQLARAKAEQGPIEGPVLLPEGATRADLARELKLRQDKLADERRRSHGVAGEKLDLRPTDLDRLTRERNQAAAQGQREVRLLDTGEKVAVLSQGDRGARRGSVSFELPRADGKPRRYSINLEGADETTAAHESFHVLTEVMHDIATAPDAPPKLKADYEALTKWMGHESPAARVEASKERIALENKAAKETLTASEQQRLSDLTAREERAAVGWEEYLKEGKAPSARLADVFSRFAGWMAKIYKASSPATQFQAQFGQELGLTPEVRAIFDRLLATEDQIAKTRDAFEFQPLPIAHRAMTPAEQQEYADATEKLQNEARTELLRELAKDQAERAKIIEEERAKLSDGINADLDKQPVYRALSFLQDRELVQVDADGNSSRVEVPSWLTGADGKTLRLDRKDIDRLYGKGAWKTLPTGTTTAKGGIGAGDLAAFFGFDDAEALVRAMQVTESRDRVVARTVQDKLNQDFGPALLENPTKLFEEAMAAEHTDVAAKRIMLEIRAMRRQLNQEIDPRTEAVADKARKEIAQRLIDEKPIADLSPGYYRRAEQGSAKRALEAALGGNLEKAMGQRETQLLNQYLYKYAREAKEKADNIREQLQKKTTDTYRAALGKAVYDEKQPDGSIVRHREYLDGHDALMSAIGMGSRKPEDFSLDDLLARMDMDAADVGFDVSMVRDIIDKGKAYNSLTTPEAIQVDAAIKNIRKSASAVNEVIVDGKRTTVRSWVDRIRDELQRRPDLGKAPSDKTQVGVLKRAGLKLQGADGGLLDIGTMAEMLGPSATDFLVNRFADARDKKNGLADKVLPQILEAFNRLPQEMRDKRHEVISGLDQDLPIPETMNEEGPRSRQWLWMAFLNMGNRGPKSNAERLTKPYGWTEDQVIAAIGKYLKPAECKFLQEILTLTDKELWPEVAAKEERKVGLPPEKIKPSPIDVTFADGTTRSYAGGYFPAKYKRDVAIGDIAERQDASIQSIYGPNYERASTAKGYTKARAAGYANVLDLNWNVLTNHLAQVTHDVAFDEYIRDSARVLMHPDLHDAIFQRFGSKRMAQLNDWLKTVAREHIDSVPESMRGWQELMNPLRSAMVAGAVGGSIPVMMANLTDAAFAVTTGEVGFGNGLGSILKGVAQSWQMPFGASEMRNRALEMSPELRNRAAVHERAARNFDLRFIGKNQSKFTLAKERVSLMMSTFMEAADALSSTQVWWGAFNDATDRGLAESDAVKAADNIVRGTLVSHERALQSAFVRDKIGPGALSVFYGWFNKRYNGIRRVSDRANVARENPDELGGTAATAKAAAYTLATIAMMGTATELMGGRGQQQDEKAWQWALRKSIAQFMSLVPFGGLGAPLADLAVTGEFKPPSEMAPPALTFVNTAISEVGKAFSEDSTASDKAALALKAAVGVALMGAKLPLRQLQRTGGYLIKLVEGQARDSSLPGILSGIIYGERDNQPANPLNLLSSQHR